MENIPWISRRSERGLVSPDAGHVVVKDALVSVHVVRHDQLLPEDVGQTPVGALRHHRLGVLGQLLVELLVQLLLPLDLLELLDQDLSKLGGAGLSAGLGGDALSARDEGGGLRQIVLSVLPTLLLDLASLTPQVLLVVL